MECPLLAKDEVESLRSQGIEPTLDELAELIELANRLQNPANQTDPLASRAPIAVGSSGLYLYPLTLQAEAWLSTVADLLEDNGNAVVCYASAVGRTPGAFDTIRTSGPALQAVTEWAMGCTATGDELADAADILVGGREPETCPGDPDAQGVDMQALFAELSVESGQTVEYWSTQTSDAMCAALSAINKKRAAAVGAQLRDADDEAQKMRDVMYCVQRIRERANGPQ